MPLANYCRKCRAETPAGESCPYCGGKLTKAGERLSFGVSRAPWRDWFCWNRLLRVGLPVWALSFLLIALAEFCSGGTPALAGLFRRGFGLTMLWLLGGMLALFWALLFCQGQEKVHYLLDKDGVRCGCPEGGFTHAFRAVDHNAGRFVFFAGLNVIKHSHRVFPLYLS